MTEKKKTKIQTKQRAALAASQERAQVESCFVGPPVKMSDRCLYEGLFLSIEEQNS